MKAKHYSVSEVFNNTNIGFIFEFYSTKDPQFIVEDLSKLISKSILLTNHHNIFPDYSKAVLVKEYDSKKSRYSLHLAQQDYNSILQSVALINEWISSYGETKLDTILKTNISFDKNLHCLYSISDMNVINLILKFDENFVYKRFPDQKDSPYTLSIKKIRPFNGDSQIRNLANESQKLYIPKDNYYGISFKDQSYGILEFNYIGGKDYQTKQAEINELIEYYVIKTYQSINEEEHDQFELNEMKRITKDFQKIQESFFDVNYFIENYKDIKVYVDMRNEYQTLKTFWPNMRNKIFEVMSNSNIEKGEINYDSQLGRFQIRNANINTMLLKDVDIVKCNVKGVLENCNLWNTKIDRSRLYNIRLLFNNSLKDSYAICLSVPNSDNILKDSYIKNNEEIINCKVEDCTILFANMSNNSKINDGCTIIVRENKITGDNIGLSDIKEIRDYKWLKKMKKNINKGYANEYIK